jgi:hypothetical protein
MSQSIEEEETLRRHARAELLANLPGIERELELLEDAGLPKGAILTLFVGAVAEYLHGEEALELEREKAMIPPEFKPSDVRMWRGILPLVDTFGQAETEFAAALMVLTCAENGDTWGPIVPLQMGLAMRKAMLAGGPLEHLKRNPFLPRPDHRRLVADGFARFIGDDPDAKPAPAIEFTPKGFDVLRKTLAAQAAS